jgi:predicted phosphodiesterase
LFFHTTSAAMRIGLISDTHGLLRPEAHFVQPEDDFRHPMPD